MVQPRVLDLPVPPLDPLADRVYESLTFTTCWTQRTVHDQDGLGPSKNFTSLVLLEKAIGLDLFTSLVFLPYGPLASAWMYHRRGLGDSEWSV
ncbi:uncharacterized protein N7498_003506 [Penicillium cinerascens]|uniref:Uncharacterized protein n=1 Tax=Penicillium cinerascens TaxID=70096 RepID=A0A9W9N2C5_9EURO|nr:uncharacterized protein N7498_003506 [Penicillium cinerascens]KAJ5211860.1 hypothetical protein N7498_003506 [Penicillium cinerascens]